MKLKSSLCGDAFLKLTWIGHGYRVSDKDAAKLARAVHHHRLPRAGYFLAVVMPRGEEATLQQTPLASGKRTRLYQGNKGWVTSKRGWVWYVDSPEDLSHYTRYQRPLSRAALQKAQRAALYAKRLENAWLVESEVKLRQMAIEAYLVAADAYEEAGDILEAMRYRADAQDVNDSGFSGEITRRGGLGGLTKTRRLRIQ